MDILHCVCRMSFHAAQCYPLPGICCKFVEGDNAVESSHPERRVIEGLWTNMTF